MTTCVIGTQAETYTVDVSFFLYIKTQTCKPNCKIGLEKPRELFFSLSTKKAIKKSCISSYIENIPDKGNLMGLECLLRKNV